MIGETLNAIGEDRPNCDEMAILFALSGNPAHRRKARGYWIGRADYRGAFNSAAQDWQVLRVLFNLASISWPGVVPNEFLSDDFTIDIVRENWPPMQTYPEWKKANGIEEDSAEA